MHLNAFRLTGIAILGYLGTSLPALGSEKVQVSVFGLGNASCGFIMKSDEAKKYSVVFVEGFVTGMNHARSFLKTGQVAVQFPGFSANPRANLLMFIVTDCSKNHERILDDVALDAFMTLLNAANQTK